MNQRTVQSNDNNPFFEQSAREVAEAIMKFVEELEAKNAETRWTLREVLQELESLEQDREGRPEAK